MSFQLGERDRLKFTYDFASQGGAIGTIDLTPQLHSLAEGIVITGWSMYVEAAVTSGGTPTITMGNTTDPDGYAADVFALVGSANAVVNSGSVAGALIWDDTNDHAIEYRIDSTAANQDLKLTIATAALTAGKLVVYMDYYKPGVVPA